MEEILTWLAKEIVQHLLLHWVWLVVAAICAGGGYVLSALIFGRRHKQEVRTMKERIADLETEVRRLGGNPSVIVNVGKSEPDPSPADAQKAHVLELMNGVREAAKRYREWDGRTEDSDLMIQVRRSGFQKRELAEMGFRPYANDMFEWQVYLEWMIPVVDQRGVDAALAEARQIRAARKKGDPPK